jgi:hypothetical protein
MIEGKMLNHKGTKKTALALFVSWWFSFFQLAAR